jgi:uncharacterized membrane protein YphA (DoxX/SURF4 family)
VTLLFVGASIGYALLCMVPAAMKLAGTGKMRAAADHFQIPWPRYRAIGVLEAAAALGVLAGLLWRPIGLAAGLGMTILLVAAVASHRRANDEFIETVSALVFLAASVAYVGIWVATLP